MSFGTFLSRAFAICSPGPVLPIGTEEHVERPNQLPKNDVPAFCVDVILLIADGSYTTAHMRVLAGAARS